MNIFKILANGDGKINEANISAFLGYLLDPKANHGLQFEFLKRFLADAVEDEDFVYEKYEYEVFLEQAFSGEGKSKQIVDIVVVCYQIVSEKKGESLVKHFLANTKDIKKIFLIENKISKNSLTNNQLIRQFESTKKELDKLNLQDNLDLQETIHSVFVTPKDTKTEKEYENSRNSLANSSHLFWHSAHANDKYKTVYDFLTDILQAENSGTIEPLSEYTKHTIKAFVQFIENDFKSQRQEEKERKNDGSYTARFIKLNEETQIEKKLEELKYNIEQYDARLDIKEPDMSIPRFPCLVLTYKGINIKLSVNYESRKEISLGYCVADSREFYTKEDWMSNKLLISEPKTIFEAIQKAQQSIDKAFE